eukprot:1445527-Rhodomonas_salina.1
MSQHNPPINSYPALHDNRRLPVALSPRKESARELSVRGELRRALATPRQRLHLRQREHPLVDSHVVEVPIESAIGRRGRLSKIVASRVQRRGWQRLLRGGCRIHAVQVQPDCSTASDAVVGSTRDRKCEVSPSVEDRLFRGREGGRKGRMRGGTWSRERSREGREAGGERRQGREGV